MIAQLPPMGWNSWDCYGAAVNEDTVRANAEYMAAFLKPCGWEYIVVDIQWARADAKDHAYEAFAALTMDEYGRLLPAPNSHRRCLSAKIPRRRHLPAHWIPRRRHLPAHWLPRP